MKKRLLSLLLTGALCLSLSAPALAAGLENFQKTNTYTAGQFTDVPAGEWYAANVQAAYELGLMEGSSETTFHPSGNLTIAEALVLACRLHSTYVGDGATFAGSGGAWYQPYVDYAVENGIITANAYSSYTATATRAQFARILAAALPAEALTAINSVTALPDVAANAAYAPAVLSLYNAGVLTGSDSAGSFKPDTTIQRSEVATIVTRMADPSLRKTFTLTPAGTGETIQPADDGQITLDDLQGVWYSKEELEYSDTVTEKEWIIEGDQLTYSALTTTDQKSTGNSWENGTITLITSDVVDMRGNSWPMALEFHYATEIQTNSAGTSQRYGTRNIYLSSVDLEAGTLTQVDTSLGIQQETVYQRVSTPTVEQKVLQVLPGQASIKDEETGDQEKATYFATSEDAIEYGTDALRHIYTHLKFPSTMSVIDIRHGIYNRTEFFDGAPDFMRPTNNFLSWNKDYYVVTLCIEAANSFGALTTDTYVCLFDMATGEAYYDLVSYASDLADWFAGNAKLEYMDLESEALLLAATVRFAPFTREEVQSMVDSVKN